MPNLAIRRDLGKLDFGDGHRLDPVFAAHRAATSVQLFPGSRGGTGLLLESRQLPPEAPSLPGRSSRCRRCPPGSVHRPRRHRAAGFRPGAVVGSVREARRPRTPAASCTLSFSQALDRVEGLRAHRRAWRSALQGRARSLLENRPRVTLEPRTGSCSEYGDSHAPMCSSIYPTRPLRALLGLAASRPPRPSADRKETRHSDRSLQASSLLPCSQRVTPCSVLKDCAAPEARLASCGRR